MEQGLINGEWVLKVKTITESRLLSLMMLQRKKQRSSKIIMSAKEREQAANFLEVSDVTIKRSLGGLTRSGLLMKHSRGVYVVGNIYGLPPLPTAANKEII
jgi:predicted transcriptional regulator of viral defense system